MILTISIPTYNRPELLHKCLVEIFNQIQDKPNVSVYVADDSDGNENKVWVEKAKQHYPQATIEYVINKKNLGIDENIKNCIRSPQAEYIWLLGEDDLLTPNAINTVLESIEIHRPTFIFANYIYCNDDHSKTSSKAVLNSYPKISQEDFNSFAENHIWSIGFIGSCIIRKSEWCNQETEKYKGSYYSHVGGIIDSCYNKKITIIGKVLVLNRSENINTFTWSSSTFPVYFSFFDVLEKSKLAFNQKLLGQVKISAQKLFSVNSIVWLAAKRADGVYDKKIFESYYAKRSDLSTSFKLLAFIFSIFPKTPLQILRRINLSRRFVTPTNTAKI